MSNYISQPSPCVINTLIPAFIYPLFFLLLFFFNHVMIGYSKKEKEVHPSSSSLLLLSISKCTELCKSQTPSFCFQSGRYSLIVLIIWCQDNNSGGKCRAHKFHFQSNRHYSFITKRNYLRRSVLKFNIINDILTDLILFCRWLGWGWSIPATLDHKPLNPEPHSGSL